MRQTFVRSSNWSARKVVWLVQGITRRQLDRPRGRENRSVRTLRLRQINAAPLHQSPRKLRKGRLLLRESTLLMIPRRSMSSAPARMVFQQFNLSSSNRPAKLQHWRRGAARGPSEQWAEGTAGRLLDWVKEGLPDELFNNPKHERTRRFLREIRAH